MSTLYSFPPIVAPSATTLVLGSMPGKASLDANQYYAHPRNAFWKIMGELYGFSASDDYLTRVAALKRAHIALWDVLRSCERPGSLDSNIVESTIIANDFPTFFKNHPSIERVVFNGGKAEAAFKKYVLPNLTLKAKISFHRAPSTSPAHAALSAEKKRDLWKQNLIGTAT